MRFSGFSRNLGVTLITALLVLSSISVVAKASPLQASSWTKYAGNPVLPASDQGFSSVVYNNGTFHVYCGYTGIYHYTSTDGLVWTADPANPVLNEPGVASVWKEGSVWYMLFRRGSPLHISLATSNDGYKWTEVGDVLYGQSGAWDGYDLDPWGIIKIGNTYHLWYSTINMADRQVGEATSTDLIHWTKDPRNPIFSDGRYCVFIFKFGGYYYLLVPHYTAGGTPATTGDIELYRDVNPTFYNEDREYLGIALNPSSSGWDSSRFDTPFVLSDTVARDSFDLTHGSLWMYYATYGPGTGVAFATATPEYPPARANVATAKTIIGRGYCSNVTVQISNITENPEPFNVSTYANATVIYTQQFTIQTTHTFAWNTTGLDYGNYTLRARTWPFPVTTSNNCSVLVTIPGDLNGDFNVTLQDLAILANAYSSKPSHSNWNPNADIDDNGVVGLSDLALLAQHYGQHYP